MEKVEQRQNKIVRLLQKSNGPISGESLAKELGVSRQIIVSDIIKIREDGISIISTPRGYFLDPSLEVISVFKVHHSVEDTRKELYLIVDMGGTIKDVFIFHKIYGEIHARLDISSRLDADRFCKDLETGKSSPLMTATAGYHYHTVSARDENTLNLIKEKLSSEGFIADLTEYEPEVLINSITNK